MKKIILPLVMLTLAAAPAAAQIVRSTTFTKQETPKVVVAENPIHDYDLLGFYYDMEHFSAKYYDGDPETFNANGFQLKYLHGFSVSKSLPMFVEFGASLSFGVSNSEDENGYVNTKGQYMNIAIPVNFAYRFNLTDVIAIKPYIGLNIKFNLLARSRGEYTDKFMDKYGDYVDSKESEWINLFSDNIYKDYDYDDVDSSDLTWKRFQVGWHIGVDFEFNKFFIGLNYGTDFNPIFKYEDNKISTSTFNIGLGFVF